MGLVFTEITLKNATDVVNVQRKIIEIEKIRQKTVKAMVDTGAGTLIINEEIQQELGLETQGVRRASMANNSKAMCKITEPVEIIWQNRSSTVNALVLPGSDKVLLGAIPLQDMDLIVDPARHVLTGAHGDEVVCLV